MPCWVAPIVAAELWGVTPGHVLGAIADGSLPSRQEYGFVLVDVAPEGTCPAPRHQGPPPPTYVVVSDEGGESLSAAGWLQEPIPTSQPVPEPLPESLPQPEPVWAPPVADDAVDPELPPLDEEEDDVPISNWRQVRSNMGRMRKPPARTPPPAAFAA